jgi:hypothetical protein
MNGLGLDKFDYATGSTSWREALLKLDTTTGSDTIQVGVIVANIDGDELFDFEAHVDFVEEVKSNGDVWTEALMACNADSECAFGRLIGGIDASHNAAYLHSAYITQELQDNFSVAETEFGIPVAVVKAIASRETNMGSYLGSVAGCPDGWGDVLGGCSGFGIMQVDKGYHEIQGPSEPLA